MRVILYFIVFFNFVVLDENKKINKIPQLGEKKLTLDLDIENLFNFNTVHDTVLTELNLKEIMNKAKAFKPSSITKDDFVLMETSFGEIKIKLYHEYAPNHCINFKKLCNSGFYDKTLFHRIVPGFILQGGDLLTRDSEVNNDGMGNPGWTVAAEFNNIKHKKGILSMARGENINSAGSQFFICLGNAKHLDGKYTAFGEISEGFDVLDLISKVPTEFKQIMKLAKEKIPNNEDANNWIEFSLNKKVYYFRVPLGIDKNLYYNDVENRINNKSRPHVPITIQKVRVLNKNNQKLNSKPDLKKHIYDN